MDVVEFMLEVLPFMEGMKESETKLKFTWRTVKGMLELIAGTTSFVMSYNTSLGGKK